MLYSETNLKVTMDYLDESLYNWKQLNVSFLKHERGQLATPRFLFHFISLLLFSFQKRIVTTFVMWKKDAVLLNQRLVSLFLLKSLTMCPYMTQRSWTIISTRGVSKASENYRHNLTMPQPPATRHVSASQSLGSTVTWARAITTSPTGVMLERSRSRLLRSLQKFLTLR